MNKDMYINAKIKVAEALHNIDGITPEVLFAVSSDMFCAAAATINDMYVDDTLHMYLDVAQKSLLKAGVNVTFQYQEGSASE